MSAPKAMQWVVPLAALVVVRAAIPLAALADSGHAVPGLPTFAYGLRGDAPGFYSASLEFIDSVGRLGPALGPLLLLSLLGCGLLLVRLWRQGRLASAWAIVLGVLAFSAAISVVIARMRPHGAGVFGWPLVWSLPLFPARGVASLDENVAFGFGLALSLVANAATLVLIAYIGLRVTGRRSVAFTGAAFYAFWPLLVGVIAGERGWQNGTWSVDAGLAMYTEPISTALVTAAVALLLTRPLLSTRLALAGIALSLATLVKLSNAAIAAAVLAVLVARLGPRRVLPYVAGALTFAPPVGAYWPKGYVSGPGETPKHPFSWDYAHPNWTDSLLFSPRTLAVLVPLAVLGALTLRSRLALALLVVPVLANATFYTFYRYTFLHPRFLFVSLPPVFVLWSAGARSVAIRTGTLVAVRWHRERGSLAQDG